MNSLGRGVETKLRISRLVQARAREAFLVGLGSPISTSVSLEAGMKPAPNGMPHSFTCYAFREMVILFWYITPEGIFYACVSTKSFSLCHIILGIHEDVWFIHCCS